MLWCGLPRADVLQIAVNTAMQVAVDRDPSFRRSVPRDMIDVCGISRQGSNPERETAIATMARALVGEAMQYLPLDAAFDEHQRKFVHQRLPLWFSASEKQAIANTLAALTGEGAKLPDAPRVRVLRPDAHWMCVEGSEVAVYVAFPPCSALCLSESI